MEKKNRWKLPLIFTVVALTLFNILPTAIYYSKPLGKPIGGKKALTIAKEATNRVESLKQESLEWVTNYLQLLDVKKYKLEQTEASPELLHISFETRDDARLFERFFPRAGQLIPFAPAKMSLLPHPDPGAKEFTIIRKVGATLTSDAVEDLFAFASKDLKTLDVTSAYYQVVEDRVASLALAAAGTHPHAQWIDMHEKIPSEAEQEANVMHYVSLMEKYADLFQSHPSVLKRFLATFSRGPFTDTIVSQKLMNHIDMTKNQLTLEKVELLEEKKECEEKGTKFDKKDAFRLSYLKTTEDKLRRAFDLVAKHAAHIDAKHTPATLASIKQNLSEAFSRRSSPFDSQTLNLQGLHPLFSHIKLDWHNEELSLVLHEDVVATMDHMTSSKAEKSLSSLIYSEIAMLSRTTGEEISPVGNTFKIRLPSLDESKSLLVLDLAKVGARFCANLKTAIASQWQPTHVDLNGTAFPIWDLETYQNLADHEKQFGLLVYTPNQLQTPQDGLRTSSAYVVAKGFQDLLMRLQKATDQEQQTHFFEEYEALRGLLSQYGFISYSGDSIPFTSDFKKDLIFEAPHFFNTTLEGTQEAFETKGRSRFAVLEFTNLKQRILVSNQIDDGVHAALLKANENYRLNQVKMDPYVKYDTPKPGKNPLLANFMLSAKKYFRGDERKVLKWGKDLAGGKSILLEVKDVDGMLVTQDQDIQAAINQLYMRVNKMGLSEVSIRQEGEKVNLDFPSAQGLSASDLIQATSMKFHMINEQFAPENPSCGSTVSEFLQDVWNEAVVTARRDIDSVNQIARDLLYGEGLTAANAQPASSAAEHLFELGLRLAGPEDRATTALDNNLSKLCLRSEHHAGNNPLVILMHSFALDGSSLTNVRAGFDPTKGNLLHFEVKSSSVDSKGNKTSPTETFAEWTSTFGEKNIKGTNLGSYSRDRGWRMAVVLNNEVISSPSVSGELRGQASIEGNFTQSEVNKLEADLKAGSLSFTPHILMEKNISPELGVKDRMLGIISTLVALALVVIVMISYYRFAGVIASVAILFNLLIMWATLQNLHATITLAGIAGVILTIGMAVDANVLVFERIREEYALSGQIASAIKVGYQKAYTAIVDSNVTTIIAALILLNFDSGPIKGFAISLIVGIVSSMFTALFMTKTFFERWAAKHPDKKLNMSSRLGKSHFRFLRHAKTSFLAVLCLCLVGSSILGVKKDSVVGMDFAGGYSFHLELDPQEHTGDYQALAEKALEEAGVKTQHFSVKTLSPSNHLKVLLSKNVDLGPTQLVNTLSGEPATPASQDNQMIGQVIKALEGAQIQLIDEPNTSITQSWNSISGQMSSAMRNQAIAGLLLALLCILVYITFRFELVYALSATMGLVIDVAVTVASIATLHALGVPVQFDLNTIAAMMIIVGYSLNDSIIIFDRIREDRRLRPEAPLTEVINHALNTTLSRTLMTSTTTLVVLLALLAIGGPSIFGFSLVTIIGVVFGTFSSLFLAAPLVLFFEKKKKSRQAKI